MKRESPLILRLLSYFPVRFLISAFLFSYILLNIDVHLKSLEKKMLLDLLDFFGVSAFYSGGNLFVGNFWSPTSVDPTVYTQMLYLIFFLSFASVTKASVERRVKILLFGALCFFSFIIVQFLAIVTLIGLGIASPLSFTQLTIILTALTGAAVTEAALYSVLFLPSPVKVKQEVRRTYSREYVRFVILMAGSVLILYFFMNIFHVETDSPLAALLAVNLTMLQVYSAYLAYFGSEIVLPDHVKLIRESKGKYPLVSFLIPAYNEEKFIANCIKSIDKAASNYTGKVEIIVINDGSTDQTSKLANQAISSLQYCSGKALDIPNSGKGVALNYGLNRVSGDVIFRIDADSIIEERAIGPIMNHFKDPLVGAVSGLIYGIQEKYIWQKFLISTMGDYIFSRRSQGFLDTIMVHPGAFSIFRRSVLLKLGGWSANLNGEDRDLTIRIGRLGYKNEFEERSVILSDIPKTLPQLRRQRVRWNIGFYHSHARNLGILREPAGPRSVTFAFELLHHGAAFAAFLFWPYLLAALLSGKELSFSATSIFSLWGLPATLLMIDLVSSVLQYIIYSYFLAKHKKFSLLKYVPLLRVYQLTLMIFMTEATEILIARTSEFTKASYHRLREELLKL